MVDNNKFEDTIINLTDSLKLSLETKNWYSALALGLTLPDICSRLESPEVYSSVRYPGWFDKYVGRYYMRTIGPEKENYVFLSGKDAYALRCSFLHQGDSNIDQQRSKDVLSDFLFVKPPEAGIFHLNLLDDTLQLQVDLFCIDICNGVLEWMDASRNNVFITNNAMKMLEIHDDVNY
jgi:hypothetical protein